MNQTLHHIRLLAGLEIEPGGQPLRMLSRDDASELAGHLATDLARVLPEAENTLLMASACLFEPNELLQPDFPAWQALEELAANMHRQSGFRPQVVAFGAHGGRMPHAALQPPPAPPQGQFIALPLLLVCSSDSAASIESKLEAELFESGSIDPPARSLLHSAAGLESVHGQLLTVNDLIALQHVQLDSVGLGGFWPVIEQVLLAGGTPQDFELPAGLEVFWQPDGKCLDIRFVTFDQSELSPDEYCLWMRAFRTLTALLDAHGIDWRPQSEDPVAWDEHQQMMIETSGPSGHKDGLTVHHHPHLGLVAWTVVEEGRLMHLYPLRPDAADQIERELAARQSGLITRCKTIHSDPDTGKLAPAEKQ